MGDRRTRSGTIVGLDVDAARVVHPRPQRGRHLVFASGDLNDYPVVDAVYCDASALGLRYRQEIIFGGPCDGIQHEVIFPDWSAESLPLRDLLLPGRKSYVLAGEVASDSSRPIIASSRGELTLRSPQAATMIASKTHVIGPILRNAPPN